MTQTVEIEEKTCPQTLLDEFCERHWTVIPILYYGRSGSYFFGSLLDDHPQLIMWPPGFLLSILSVPWPEKCYGRISTRECLEIHWPIFERACTAIKEGTANGIAPFGSLELTKMGKNRNESALLNTKKISAAINQVLDGVNHINRRQWFIAIHMIYWLARGNKIEDLPENPKIVHHLHYWNEKLVDILCYDFPDLKIIQTVRRPVQAYISHIKHTIESKDFDPTICRRLTSLFLFGGRSIRDSYHSITRAVRLEDLNNRPEQTMRKMCEFLGIQWDNCLLESTTNGLLRYEAPGGSNEAYTGFHNQALHRTHHDFVSDHDEERLEALIAPYYQRWEYQRKGTMSLGDISQSYTTPYKFLTYFQEQEWPKVYDQMNTYLTLSTNKYLSQVIEPIIPNQIRGQLI